ncbi:MAG: ABC transporter ATP-binding protein/permease [Acidobacteriota bacterium]|nr:ABC transporter ATP-binding protein/permease [Acidobacteriota bacterium]MDH3785738.1 ABC transporter ATP-binding protein/permease [Acidobacteriota bacterium]
MSAHGHHPGSADDRLGKVYDAEMFRRLWAYVRPHRTLVFVSFVIIFVLGAAQLVQPYLIRIAIDDHIGTRNSDGLGILALWFGLALLGEFLLRWLQIYVLERTGQNVVYDLRTDAFAHLQRLPSSFFDRNPVGRLMTRVTSDVEAIHEVFTSGLVMILADLVKVIGIVVILLAMDWRLALVTFAVIPPIIFVTLQFRGRMRSAYRTVRGAIARLNAFLQENVTGMRIVQMFGRENESAEAFAEINAEHREAQLKAVVYESSFTSLAELVAAVALAVLLWAGGYGILAGMVTFGTLVAFIEYSAKFFRPVQELSQRYTVMQAAMAAAERIFGLLDTEVSIKSSDGAIPVPEKLAGDIRFENVTFGYDDERPVLKDVSFHIRPGERIGVVGWTGSGKTTLIRLLVRLYDVQQGRILLDGVDIRKYRLRDLRRSIGIVLQDPFLFAGSVGGNISLGDPTIGPDRVKAAARAVQVDRFIETLPAGYDERIRERGSNLSVGEKQLLTFARAVAFDPGILVLDEATASVDPRTEQKIQLALATLLSDRTSILIAHRLATVRDADRILVLHQGELREQGTHEELLVLENGIYRTLYALQATA